MTLSKKIPLAGLAIVMTVLGLYFAELAGGPIARAVFGVPVGFHEHFTSPDSYRQALLVQGASVCIGFLALGAVLGRKIPKVRLGQMARVSIPVTVLALDFLRTNGRGTIWQISQRNMTAWSTFWFLLHLFPWFAPCAFTREHTCAMQRSNNAQVVDAPHT
jgi:hypothetical protein